MSTSGDPDPSPPEAPPASSAAMRSGVPQRPAADMMASGEMQAWLNRLQVEDRTIGVRNRYLALALGGGLLTLLVVFWIVYRATIGAYAVIDGIEISQHPANQSRLEIKFRVLSPGMVYCRRTSGPIEADLIDTFAEPCDVDRPWSWVYRPGEDIDVKFWYRRGLFRRLHEQTFTTADRADIVILMDTTGSMSPSIDELKKKCATFSEQLRKQALKHRFALIGFGDTQETSWIDRRDFTSDVDAFVRAVDEVRRFDGGDAPESALDALEAALQLPFDRGAIRQFYLVTDATYHEPSRSGATAEDVATRLHEEKVLLWVFSKARFKPDYMRLLGEAGRFREIGHFGRVLSEGRVLGD
ncbi:MAG: VWA domain-containing protein [Pirellulales bacterium]|nr:VWA domain-containing protein [Pirellulales bacterium]